MFNQTILELCARNKRQEVAQKIEAISAIFKQLNDDQKKQYMTEGISYGIENAIKFMENTELNTILKQIQSAY